MRQNSGNSQVRMRKFAYPKRNKIELDYEK